MTNRLLSTDRINHPSPEEGEVLDAAGLGLRKINGDQKHDRPLPYELLRLYRFQEFQHL